LTEAVHITDQAEREAALDPARSFIVQAPAGSGKTELLVRRFLGLLEIVENPEEILAITFTKKAAAEMRKRVLDKVADPAAIGHRLRIQTIDSLCASLTRRMPVLARFGAQPAIAEEPSELYREAAARVFRDLDPATEKLLAHLDNNVALATGLLAEMLRTRDRWLRRTGAAPTREELEAALVSERERLLAGARALYPEACEALAHELLTKDFTWRKKHALAQSFAEKGEAGEALRAALEALCRMPPARYDERQWAALEAILELLLPAVAQLKVVFGESGEADFTELAHGALQALGAADDPSELLLSLDRRISHVLVDEFQDTSQSQFQLIERLTSGWEPGDGRSLFLVGDPMQSIYRFREADVSLFLRARQQGIGALRLEPLTLRTNFRSQARLVDWFNASFVRVLPDREDETSGAVPYSPATAKHAALAGEAASWHCFADRGAEAKEVVRLVRQAGGKKAILVRNRSHLDEIVPALKEAGLRFRAVQIEQLGEKQVVQDLYALTRALTHLGDRIAWLAVLRAPWCGLLLEDLCLLCEGAPEKSLISDLLRDVGRLSPDGQARAQRAMAVLGPAIENRMRGTLRDCVEGAWLALGGPACLAGEGAEATELEDAEIYLDELERLETAGAVDFVALSESLGRLYALPDVTAGDEAVEIMTIHKAKGLEFDTVIVPALDRSPRAGTRPLFDWKGLAGGRLLLAPIDETGAGEDPTYKYVRELNREADDVEAGRLFYVAATRAKERLHLLACVGCDRESGELKIPPRRSLLEKLWWQARGHCGELAAIDPPTVEAETAIPDVLRRLPADFALAQLPAPAAWSAPAQSAQNAALEFSWAGETARHVGTVVHRWLQRMAEEELDGWDAARVDSLHKRFRNDLLQRGVPEGEVAASAQSVVDSLKNALADERGRWILGAHPQARSEYRLRAHSAEGTRNYVMDRVFMDQGVLWIVDYKTSRHEGADLEAFLDRELERYAPQLASYAALLGDSRQALYFPLLRGWRVR
jgi:ATP-dependent exoDNAse (exonuclease V) beta subunit